MQSLSIHCSQHERLESSKNLTTFTSSDVWRCSCTQKQKKDVIEEHLLCVTNNAMQQRGQYAFYAMQARGKGVVMDDEQGKGLKRYPILTRKQWCR